MNKDRKEKILWVLKEISKDIEKDVSELDGQPFTWKTVVTQLGYHAAAIQVLAEIIIKLIEDDDSEEN